MLQYAACLSYLGAEMVICSAIILPLPQGFRRKILETIAKVWNEQVRIRWFVKFVNLIVFGMLVDAALGVYRSYSVTSAPHVADAAGAPGRDVTVNLFESERNMVLSMFILFLFMLIYRFQSMILQVVSLERELESEEKYVSQDDRFKKLKVQNEELARAIEKNGSSPVINYEATQAAQE